MEQRLHDTKDDTGPKKKRHELSRSATNSLTRHDVSIKINFN